MTLLKNSSFGVKLGLSGILIGLVLYFITPFTSFGGVGAPTGAFLQPLYFFLDTISSIDALSSVYPFILIFAFFLYYALLGTLIAYVVYFFAFKLPQKNIKPRTKKKK